MKRKIPFNLQFFASNPPEGGDGDNGGSNGSNGGSEGNGSTQTVTPEIDYDKLASIIQGRQNAAEDSVLKNYFKQQGLSQEDVASAIESFKAEKLKNTPDVASIQSQMNEAKKEAVKAMIEKEATLEALSLGLDAKTIPYVLRLADMSAVIGDDGKINSESLKKALNQVLEDVPQLKPAAGEAHGFRIGAENGGNNGASNDANDKLRKLYGLKPKQ